MRATLADPRSVGRATLPTGRTCGLTDRLRFDGLLPFAFAISFSNCPQRRSARSLTSQDQALILRVLRLFNANLHGAPLYINAVDIDVVPGQIENYLAAIVGNLSLGDGPWCMPRECCATAWLSASHFRSRAG